MRNITKPDLKMGMNKGIVAAFLGGAVVAAAFAQLTRDKWIEVPLAALLSVSVAIPAAVVAAASLMFTRGGGRPRLRQARILCLAVIAFCAASWAGVPLHKGLSWYDQSKAREFCEYLSPVIERYRVEHGNYPDEVISIVAVQGNGKLPKLIENGFQYHRREESFVMAFIVPDHPFAWNVFDSGHRDWHREAD
jgi:hypothetical protein